MVAFHHPKIWSNSAGVRGPGSTEQIAGWRIGNCSAAAPSGTP